ncbi:carboxypeptidase-like regulatory domain-containing protein [Flavobacterium sufflavum]|uniref:Carboxypeptidase-like regulatory domain-containing protein n=1 Tax=Flavobacterium sufflavum TaxID=1921138 RepID=A0A437KSA8_9FLAO|nr:carboxypeptidase-like regulatory domain-containing protein [Flavobacterium sufflavum]RVT74940.1 carboxypeptidase-like regulatory domain-containing protein [Flavobacterium sufflavum]
MKKIKNYIPAFILLVNIISYSQNKEILVFDSSTKLPIESVNIYYPGIQEGTFTNSDGKAIINILDYDLKISHIAYEEIIINYKELKNLNTFFLTPKSINLNEVVVRSFNLTKALNYVLENYENLYENKAFEKECNFKETLSIDNKLKRLIVTKVNWWSKSYKIKHLSDLKLRLGSIDFNKNNPMDIFTDIPKGNIPSNSGFIDTKSIIGSIYLNSFLINFLKYNPNLNAFIENSTANETIVSFTSEWKRTYSYSYRSRGKIIFDKATKAIISFTYEVENKDRITQSVIYKWYKEFSYENINSISTLNFRKNTNNKWALNSFETSADFSITYNDIKHQGNIKNNLYVLKDAQIDKVKNVGLISLSKPIYQNLPKDIVTNSNSILLSNEENNFIEGK